MSQRERLNRLAEEVIGAAKEVHRRPIGSHRLVNGFPDPQPVSAAPAVGDSSKEEA